MARTRKEECARSLREGTPKCRHYFLSVGGVKMYACGCPEQLPLQARRARHLQQNNPSRDRQSLPHTSNRGQRQAFEKIFKISARLLGMANALASLRRCPFSP